MGGNGRSSQGNYSSSSVTPTVTQALEIARDSADGARDPIVIEILENAMTQIWARVQAHPNSYVMTRDEFAVFNYFQHRFVGEQVAIAARKRYWDSNSARPRNGA